MCSCVLMAVLQVNTRCTPNEHAWPQTQACRTHVRHTCQQRILLCGFVAGTHFSPFLTHVQVVKGLVSGAQEAGVTIRTQQRVTQIVTTPGDQRVTGVQLEDGSVVAADVVVANRWGAGCMSVCVVLRLPVNVDVPGFCPASQRGSQQASTHDKQEVGA